MVLNNPGPQSDAVSSDLTIGVCASSLALARLLAEFAMTPMMLRLKKPAILKLELKAFMAKVQSVGRQSA